MTHLIPPITDPLGRHWSQPPREEIILDDTHALMTPETWAKLPAYDSSLPSGVYNGKMWRREERENTPPYRVNRRLLCWYGPSEKPDHCSINFRDLLLAEGGAK